MLSSRRMYEMHPACSFKTGCYSSPSGLSLTGKVSDITFKISSISVAEDVAEVFSFSSIDFCFGVEAFLFYEATVFASDSCFFFFD
jgi:hypothetical protein